MERKFGAAVAERISIGPDTPATSNLLAAALARPVAQESLTYCR
jgi:hypothetical protein